MSVLFDSIKSTIVRKMQEKIEKEQWVVITDDCIPLVGDDGMIYRYGSGSLVHVPLFRSRKEAYRFARKAKRALKARWTKTIKAQKHIMPHRDYKELFITEKEAKEIKLKKKWVKDEH